MTEIDSNEDLLMQITEDYLQRRRRGEKISLETYCAQHPDVAEELRSTLRTFELVEDLGPTPDELDDEGPVAIFDLKEIGGYRILGEVGRGGMGVVYDAMQESLGRRVALKVLPSRPGADRQAASRFLREARAAASMHHKNIVPVFEVGEEGERYYYAMQLIQGHGLDAVIDELGDLPEESFFDYQLTASGESRDANPSLSSTSSLSGVSNESGRGGARRRFFRSVAKIGQQAASALAYAHARGVVHRDIKPSNLLLDQDGTVWVSDFGLAKTDDDGLTQTGEILGTLRYMAPERFKGQCDVRADIYALGLTLFELLAFRPAYPTTDRLELIESIRRGEPLRLRAACPQIPRDLETIILKATQVDPTARYDGANHLAEDLRRFLADEPIQARRQSIWERTVRWVGRNRRLAASMAAVFLLMIAMTAGSLLFTLRIDGLRNEAVGLRDEAVGLRDEAVEARYFSQMNLAGSLASEPIGFLQIPDVLAQWGRGRAGRDLRGWEWYYLRGLTTGDSKRLQQHAGEVWSVEWSPDQTMIASASLDGTVLIHNLTTGESSPPLPHPDSTWCVAWSPDGKRLATACDDGIIRLWRADTWEVVHELAGHAGHVGTVAWNQAGSRLVSAGGDGTARLWDVATASQLGKPMQHGKSSVRGAVWSPDGNYVATVPHPEPHILVWDVQTQEVVKRIGNQFGINHVAWNRDATKLASSDITGALRIWDVHSGVQLHALEDHAAESLRIDWSDDGDWLASSSRDSTVRVWNANSFSPFNVFVGHNQQATCVDWDHQSSRLVSGDAGGMVRLNDVTPHIAPVFRLDRSPVVALRWHPDSVHLTAASEQLSFGTWNTKTNAVDRRLDTIKLDGMPSPKITLSPSGDSFSANWSREIKILDLDSLESRFEDSRQYERDRWGEVRWSRDGSRFAASVRRDFVDLWDARSWKPLEPVRIPGDNSVGLYNLAWSHDDTLLAASDDNGGVYVWDVASRTLRARTSAQIGLDFISWDPRGRRLAMVRVDTTDLLLWDMTSDDPPRAIMNNGFRVRSVSWSPDASRLAVASQDGTVKIFDTRTWQLTLMPHAAGLARTVAWSPDGMRIAAGTDDGRVHIWDASRGYDLERGER